MYMDLNKVCNLQLSKTLRFMDLGFISRMKANIYKTILYLNWKKIIWAKAYIH